jgi:2-oxoglutarate dehydrogenase E2 component (dihydrolipoamide succinyltransferase)
MPARLRILRPIIEIASKEFFCFFEQFIDSTFLKAICLIKEGTKKMAIVEVKVPAAGESVQEAMIGTWFKSSGDYVELDEAMLELETDKASMELVAEAAGVIETLFEEGAVVKVGDVIAKIDTSKAQEAAPSPSQASADEAPAASAPAQNANLPDGANGPAVNKMARESGVNPASVAGTGKDGRVTKGDMLKASTAPAPAPTKAAPKPSAPKPNLPSFSGEREEVKKPLSMMRRRISERLMNAKHSTAMLTTFNEVDMTAILDLRKKYKDAFIDTHGVKLGFMGFFLKAASDALMAFPDVNAYLDGTDICYHNYADISVAVSTEKGLVVPVVRNVDKLSISQIEASIGDLALRARNKQLGVDEMSGGTFTVTNGGVFGSLLSTPIINPPQSAILGMHKTQQRPMVMPDGSIQARPMMYLALSYDHRIIDGKEAVSFLVRIKENLEDPARLLLLGS